MSVGPSSRFMFLKLLMSLLVLVSILILIILQPSCMNCFASSLSRKTISLSSTAFLHDIQSTHNLRHGCGDLVNLIMQLWFV